MWDLIPKKLMPPTRIARYCCAVLKETAGKDRFVVTGVRWAESTQRATNRGALEVQNSDRKKSLILNNDNEEDRQLFENCQMKGKRVCNPIIDWTDRDVWDYLIDQKVETNPLYNEGFCRVGCVGCPMAGKARYAEFDRWPGFQKNYIRTFDRMLEARKASGKADNPRWGTTGVDVFHWWIEDGVLPGQVNIWEDYENATD